MSMNSAFRDDDTLYCPDEETVPESHAHRNVSNLIAQAAAHVLGDQADVAGNLNWYPTDGGNAIAPDLMVLPFGTIDWTTKSYQQGSDGPTPSVAVEVPSGSDDYPGFHNKLRRYQRLGVPVYIVMVERGAVDVTRLGPSDDEHVRWLGRPCPELGGVAFQVDGERLAVRTPDGLSATSTEAFTELLVSRADAALAELEAARAEAERLAGLLRQHGIDPGTAAPG